MLIARSIATRLSVGAEAVWRRLFLPQRSCRGMNPHEPSESFEAARRRHLIEATIEALADVGFKAASLSQIARRADVSTGLFAHYFGDKDGLLEATLRFMAARLVRATRSRLRAASSPRKRLYAVPDSALADAEFERRTSAVWLAFWGQITHSARYQRIQYIYQRRMLSNLKHDLRRLVAPDRVETYANMIAAMIDGVWIRSHANPTQREGREARALVRGLIDGLIAQPDADFQTVDATPVRVPTAPRRSARRDDATLRQAMAEVRAARRLWAERAVADRAEALRELARKIESDGDALARLEARITRQPVKKIVKLCIGRAAEGMRRAAERIEARMPQRIAHAPSLFEYRGPSAAALAVIVGDQEEPLREDGPGADDQAPLLRLLSPLAGVLGDGQGACLSSDPATLALVDRIVALSHDAGLPPGLVHSLPGLAASSARLPLDARIAAPARRMRSATILCDDVDIDAAAERVARGVMPWAAGPDLGHTPMFVPARLLSPFARALEHSLCRLPAGDPLDPNTAVARSAVGVGDALRQGLADGRLKHHPNPACDLFIAEGPWPAAAAPGLLLIAYADDDDLLARLSANCVLDTAGLLHGGARDALGLANQIPVQTCFGGRFAATDEAFLIRKSVADRAGAGSDRRIFWGTAGDGATGSDGF